VSTIISREYLTDYVGSYVIFTYDDGHQETQPPNRPQSREDVQRQIRIAQASSNATQALAAERSRFTKTAAQAAAPNAQALGRADFDTLAGLTITNPYAQGVNAVSEVAKTASASDATVSTLISSLSLGSPVVGENAGAEYTADTDPTASAKTLERTREVSNA